MGLPALYDLTHDLQDWLEIEDPTEEDQQLLAIVSGQIERKAESICKLVRYLETTAEQFKAEEKRISDRRKSLENKSANVREFMKQALLNADILKVDAGTFKVSVSLSPGTLVIDDMALIPGEFKTIVTEIKPDKAAIKAAIKTDPHSINGAHIEAGFSLRIS